VFLVQFCTILEVMDPLSNNDFSMVSGYMSDRESLDLNAVV